MSSLGKHPASEQSGEGLDRELEITLALAIQLLNYLLLSVSLCMSGT